MVSAHGLTKTFGDFTAVAGIDLQVARGEGSPPQLIREHATREVLELRFALDEQHRHAAELCGLADRRERVELPGPRGL